jgi:hypothetical protein
MLVDLSIWLKDHQEAFWCCYLGWLCYINISLSSFRLYTYKKYQNNMVGMALAPIYYYSALVGKYLELATSSHPIES